MWLDELNDLVIELSTKIDQHREILQKSESSTRYCLIDPLLTALRLGHLRPRASAH